MPLLTVILPNYNHAAFISKAIESVLTQDFSDFELLVLDDASTDTSLEMIKPYLADPRVHLIPHAKNRGVIALLNEGLQKAQGKYFHGLSADDFYLPYFLSQSIEQLEKYPEVGISLCNERWFFDESSIFHSRKYIPAVSSPIHYTPQHLPSLFKQTHLYLGGRSCIAKTNLLKKYGGFDPKLLASCDWYALTTIGLKTGIVYIPQELVCWREVSTSFSSTTLKHKTQRVAMYAHLLQKIDQLDPLLKKRFKQAGELGCVLKYAPLELLKRPSYWSSIPVCLKRYVSRKWFK
ncbi:MAG: hypothetical protein S4CHLAM123_13030 [Chlamydiales bacterium]|nr:hypothetical protein [Chlamydiales bacterium]